MTVWAYSMIEGEGDHFENRNIIIHLSGQKWNVQHLLLLVLTIHLFWIKQKEPISLLKECKDIQSPVFQSITKDENLISLVLFLENILLYPQ